VKLQWDFGGIPKTLHGLMRAFVHHPSPRFPTILDKPI
jgi:hypothetical protein